LEGWAGHLDSSLDFDWKEVLLLSKVFIFFFLLGKVREE
jgi:hypothetical protein